MIRSYFVIPLSVIFHICAINVILYVFTPETYDNGYGILYYNLTWLIATFSIDFYRTAKKDGFRNNFYNFLRLFILYGIMYYTSFLFLGNHSYNILYITLIYIFICALLVLFRLAFYKARKYYRAKGYSNRRVVVIGRDRNLRKLREIIDGTKEGYQYMGYFDNSLSPSPTYLGPVEKCYEYIFEHNIAELYCIASRLTKEEIQRLMHLADNSLIRVKIVPDNKELFSRAMSIELYGAVPILNLRASPLELEYANIVKRVFDVIFSSLVIVFILSWLTPIVYLIVKLDSKGPLFFKQKRHGINKKCFWCYKFRSMAENKDCDKVSATKNDMRVTKVGRILRKTNIDELPQFLNVLKGDMSVVGPRPHMEYHTEQFEKSVDKYLVRHFLKPGITGLAQIKGYRGEIVEKSDIMNRIRYDIFYMEKWSLKFDLLIIYYTMVNAMKGEKKAY